MTMQVVVTKARDAPPGLESAVDGYELRTCCSTGRAWCGCSLGIDEDQHVLSGHE
jgi:hypothetical protein